MHFAIWIVTLLLIGLWSLLSWGVHALLSIDVKMVGQLGPHLDQLPGAAWLDIWVPGWRELLVGSAELMQTLLSWLGAAGPVIVWVLWALGTGGLVLCALLASGVVALVRKAIKPPAPPAPPVQPAQFGTRS